MSTINQKYLDTECKVINLMLRYRDVVGEMIDQKLSPDFFQEKHRPLVQSIYYVYSSSEGKRLLTDDHYRNILIEQGTKGDISVALQVYHECLFGVPHSNTKDDFDLLKRQLIDAFVHKGGNSSLQKFQDSVQKMGYLQAMRQYVDELSNLINFTESNNPDFLIVDELREKYTKSIKERRDNPGKVLRCKIPEINDAMNVGFKAGHTSLVIGATGGHKCLAHYEKCILKDGSQVSVKDLHARQNNGEKLSILSYDEKKGKLYHQPVQKIISNGIKKCLRVTTSLGFSVDVTDNHPFLQLHGYEEAKNLKVGEHVGMARSYKFGNKEIHSALSFWLGCMYSDGGTSQPLYTFTNFDDTLVESMRIACKFLKGELKQKKIHGEFIDGNYYITGLRAIGIEYGLDKHKAINKSLHPSIFSWDKFSLKVFLKAMFECDGCFRCFKESKKNGNTTRCAVIYSSSSKLLAVGVRDLMMKFDIVAKLDHIKVKYKGSYKDSWQLKIRDIHQVRRFVKEIGFYDNCAKDVLSKQSLLDLNISPNRNKDLIPSAIWDLIERKFILRQKSYRAYRRAKENGKFKRVAKRGAGINRDSLVELAKYLDNDEQLMKLATQDVLWDQIVSIESVEKCETFDISMPVHHNFVTNGFITHNSNLMINLSLQLYENGANVLFLPLEMDWEDFVSRIISNIGDVSYKSLLNPALLTEKDLKSIDEAKSWMSNNNKFALLDVVGERLSIPGLKRELEKRVNYFSPDILVVDYLGLIKTDTGFAGRHDLALGELTKSLKYMGKQYGFHVITAAQMGRADIKRLREEGTEVQLDSTAVRGSQEVSSDVEFIFAMTAVPDEQDRLKLHIIKSRYGPSGQTKELQLNADRCRIASTKLQLEQSLDADIMNEEWIQLNQPVPKVQEEKDKPIIFQSMNPDSLDDDWDTA